MFQNNTAAFIVTAVLATSPVYAQNGGGVLDAIDTPQQVLSIDDAEEQLANASTNSEIIRLTRDVLNSGRIPPDRTAVFRKARFDAITDMMLEIEEEMAAAKTVEEIERIVSKRDAEMNDLFDRGLDRDHPQLKRVTAQIDVRLASLRAQGMRDRCVEQLSALVDDDRLYDYEVIADGGTVPFWRFACGLGDRGFRIGEIADAQSQEMLHVKGHNAEGDYVTLGMKIGETGPDTQALVGVYLSDVLTSTPFTLPTWKAYVTETLSVMDGG